MVSVALFHTRVSGTARVRDKTKILWAHTLRIVHHRRLLGPLYPRALPLYPCCILTLCTSIPDVCMFFSSAAT